MRKLWNAFWTDESGQDLAEYALLVALIAIAVIIALPPVATAIRATFGNVSNSLNNSNSGTAP